MEKIDKIHSDVYELTQAELLATLGIDATDVHSLRIDPYDLTNTSATRVHLRVTRIDGQDAWNAARLERLANR